MRRLARWTLKALTVLSLLLCVATVGLWVRSDLRFDEFWCAKRGGRLSVVQSGDGTLLVASVDACPFADAALSHRVLRERQEPAGLPLYAMLRGGAISRLSSPGRSGSAYVEVWRDLDSRSPSSWPERDEPDGMVYLAGPLPYHQRRLSYAELALASAALPAAWLGRRLRRVVQALRAVRLRQEGRCASCYYDLTGNVSGVCPECGNAIVEGNA